MYVGVSEGGCRFIFLTVIFLTLKIVTTDFYVKFLLDSGMNNAKFT